MKFPYSYGLVRILSDVAIDKQASSGSETNAAVKPKELDTKAKDELINEVTNSKLPDDQKKNILDQIKDRNNFSLVLSQAMSALRSGMPTEQVVAIFEKQMAGSPNAREIAMSVVAIYENSKKDLNSLSTVHSLVKELRGKFEEDLNFNDALDILLKNPDAFAKFTKKDTYTRRSNRDFDDTVDPSAAFQKALDDKGYVTKARYMIGDDNLYSRSELEAILELRDAIKDPKVNALLKRGTNIQRSVRIEKDAEKIKTLSPQEQAHAQLAQLVDFSHDGKLTSTNAKQYSDTFVFAMFQKMFGGGKDAQLHVATELAMFSNLSKRVNTQDDLAKVIATVTGRDTDYIKTQLTDTKKFALLVQEFQRSFLTQAAQTTPEVAARLDAEKARAYKTERANEQANRIEFIKSALVKEGLPNRVNSQLKEAGFADLENKTMEELLARTAFLISINPRFFASAGASTKVTDTTTNTTTNTTTTNTQINQTYLTTTVTDPKINTNVDTHTFTQFIKDVVITKTESGKVLSTVTTDRKPEVTVTQNTTVTKGTPTSTSERKLIDEQKIVTSKTETTQKSEKKRESNVTPNIVIGFNIGAMQMEGQGYSVEAGLGASMVGSADGVIFPISASVRIDMTVSDSNAWLQTSDLKGNFTIGDELVLTGNTGRWIIPSIGFNINPNNVKDAIKGQRVALKNMWPLLGLTEDGKLDDSKIAERLAAMERQANSANPVDEALLMEISVMRKMIADTKSVVAANTDMRAKKAIILQDTAAFEQVYMAAIHDGLRGFHTAGINITLIPMISAIFLGVNFQHVTQSASKNKGVDATERKVLKSEASKLADTKLIKEFVTGFDEKTGSVSLKSAEDVASGLIVLDGVKMTTNPDGTARVTPAAGNSLRIEAKSFMTGEGIEMRGITIKQFKDTQQQVKVTPLVAEVKTEADNIETAGEITNIYKNGVLSADARLRIYELSRQNRYLIAAISAISSRDYAEAERQIMLSGTSAKNKKTGSQPLKFLQDAIKSCATDEDKKNLLNNINLATLGSRRLRAKKEISYSEAQAEHDRNKKTFNNILNQHLKIEKPDMAKFQKSYEEHDKAIMKHDVEVKNLASGSLLAAISADNRGPFRSISGSMAIAQLNSEGKPTVRKLAYITGDLDVLNKVSEATDGDIIRDYILKIEKSSGEFQKNLDITNARIPGEQKFSAEQYQEYLLSGAIPEHLKTIVAEGPRAMFVTARAMVRESVCINDVYALGYPTMKFKGKQVKPEPTPVVMSKPTITFVESRSGDTYTNDSGVSEATFGINYKKEVVEQVISKTIEKSKVTTTPGETNEQEKKEVKPGTNTTSTSSYAKTTVVEKVVIVPDPKPDTPTTIPGETIPDNVDGGGTTNTPGGQITNNPGKIPKKN